MSNFTPPPRKKNALDNTKLRLSAPTPGVAGKFASLSWMLVNNNPRIVVYTNDPNDTGESKNYGKINANLDLPIFYALINQIDEVANNGGEVKMKLENKNHTWFGGKRSPEPVVVSEVHIGKDGNGVWISVTAKDRPRIKFYFTLSRYHEFVKSDGAPLSQAESSIIAARGYTRLLANIMTHLAVTEYTEPPPKDGNNNRGRSDWKNKGNQGGGSSSGGSSGGDSFGTDDDIPF